MAQTVYDRIQTMTKDELQKFIYYIYLWGHINEKCGLDDESFYKHFLDKSSNCVDNITYELEHLQLHQVREVCIEDGVITYLGYKFLSVYDATQYIVANIHDVVKIDDVTYATATTVYKIIPCGGYDLS